MTKHDPGRTLISPLFYSVQIDVAYGFQAVPWKGARTKVKVRLGHFLHLDRCYLHFIDAVAQKRSTQQGMVCLEQYSSTTEHNLWPWSAPPSAQGPWRTRQEADGDQGGRLLC